MKGQKYFMNYFRLSWLIVLFFTQQSPAALLSPQGEFMVLDAPVLTVKNSDLNFTGICDRIPFHQGEELTRYHKTESRLKTLLEELKRQPSTAGLAELNQLRLLLRQTVERLQFLSGPEWTENKFDAYWTWSLKKESLFEDHRYRNIKDKIKNEGLGAVSSEELKYFQDGTPFRVSMEVLNLNFLHRVPDTSEIRFSRRAVNTANNVSEIFYFTLAKRANLLDLCQHFKTVSIEALLIIKGRVFTDIHVEAAQKIYFYGGKL